MTSIATAGDPTAFGWIKVFNVSSPKKWSIFCFFFQESVGGLHNTELCTLCMHILYFIFHIFHIHDGHGTQQKTITSSFRHSNPLSFTSLYEFRWLVKMNPGDQFDALKDDNWAKMRTKTSCFTHSLANWMGCTTSNNKWGLLRHVYRVEVQFSQSWLCLNFCLSQVDRWNIIDVQSNAARSDLLSLILHPHLLPFSTCFATFFFSNLNFFSFFPLLQLHWCGDSNLSFPLHLLDVQIIKRNYTAHGVLFSHQFCFKDETVTSIFYSLFLLYFYFLFLKIIYYRTIQLHGVLDIWWFKVMKSVIQWCGNALAHGNHWRWLKIEVLWKWSAIKKLTTPPVYFPHFLFSLFSTSNDYNHCLTFILSLWFYCFCGLWLWLFFSFTTSFPFRPVSIDMTLMFFGFDLVETHVLGMTWTCQQFWLGSWFVLTLLDWVDCSSCIVVWLSLVNGLFCFVIGLDLFWKQHFKYEKGFMRKWRRMSLAHHLRIFTCATIVECCARCASAHLNIVQVMRKHMCRHLRINPFSYVYWQDLLFIPSDITKHKFTPVFFFKVLIIQNKISSCKWLQLFIQVLEFCHPFVKFRTILWTFINNLNSICILIKNRSSQKSIHIGMLFARLMNNG